MVDLIRSGIRWSTIINYLAFYRIYAMRTALLLLIFFAQLCGQSIADTKNSAARPLATYDRFLPLALAGDPDIQHFLGYMFFYGEGVELSYESSHYWFHQAAEEGDSRAQRNLGIFHSLAVSRIPESYYSPDEANFWFSLVAASSDNPDISTPASKSYSNFLVPNAEKILSETEAQQIGKTVYVTYCAGCHGFDGYAAYPEAPSFALGENLNQSDDVLVDSIFRGKGAMSSWGGTLTRETIRKSLSYIRNLHQINKVENIFVVVDTQLTPQFIREQNDHIESGETIYSNFCGGCHGFNGIAWYVKSPSFALRERLEKTDVELANSIKSGLGEMPSWEYMLSPEQIDWLVKYIRTFAEKYEKGITQELEKPPQQYLRFRTGLVNPQAFPGN